MTYTILADLIRFAYALFDAGAIDGTDIIRFFERPDKWSREHTCWLELGRPTTTDDRWEDFVDGVLDHQRLSMRGFVGGKL